MESIYDCLAQHGFSEPKDAKLTAGRLSKRDVERFFEDYERTVSNIPLEPGSYAGHIDILPDSWADSLPLSVIRQLVLYANVIYLHDPILDCLYEWKSLDVSPNYVLPLPDRDRRVGAYLQEFAEKIEDILTIKPLVVGGFVRFVPSQLLGPRTDPGAMYMTSFYGPEVIRGNPIGAGDHLESLPSTIIDYAQEHLQVYNVELIDKHYVIQRSAQLSPGRMIAVLFPGDPKPKIFNLFEIRIKDEETRQIDMFLNLQGGGQLVDARTFLNWVEGSRTDFLLERVRTLQRDLYLASLSGARFLTNLPTSKDLAGLNLQVANDGSQSVVSALLQVSLPYFDGVSDANLVKARKNEAAFYDFRTALGKAFKAVESCSAAELQAQADEIVRDVLIAPVARIEARMKSLRRNLFLDALMLAGTLGATILTQGSTLTTAAAMLVMKQTLSEYKSLKSEQDKIKESASFFYWEATKQSRKRHRSR
ncbi:MAG: hypothetical protein ABSG91_07315 [Syntrophobacteraceae bacterium]